MGKKVKDLIIVGCGGFGREVVEFVKLINQVELTWNFLGFVDDNDSAKTIEGYSILGNLHKLFELSSSVYVCVATADLRSRKRIVDECEKHGVKFATIICPDLNQRGNLCTVGEGSIIATSCEMAINTHIGRHCILNTAAALGHDSVIGDFVDMMPYSAVMGNAKIGNFCYLGVRSTILNGISIPDHSVIGACACVIEDIKEPGTYVGLPANMVRPYVGMRSLTKE